MKICEWFLGVEYDVYHKVMYFLLYLDYEKLYVELCEKLILVNAYMLIDWDVVGEYIYIDWIVNVVGDCIYDKC